MTISWIENCIRLFEKQGYEHYTSRKWIPILKEELENRNIKGNGQKKQKCDKFKF